MTTADCAQQRSWFPAAVEAAQEGKVLGNWHLIQAHLDLCPDCALEYAWLLKLAELDETDQLPFPPSLESMFPDEKA